MATGLLETGPKLDWTRDNKIFDHYQICKEKVELIFSSALEESSTKQKVSYLRYWMGEQGIPLIKKWTALGKLLQSSRGSSYRRSYRNTPFKWINSTELLGSSRSRIQT